MLPAAGVAKLRDVTKSTFDKHVDDDNRLGGWDIINQICETQILILIMLMTITESESAQFMIMIRRAHSFLENLIDKFLLNRELGW